MQAIRLLQHNNPLQNKFPTSQVYIEFYKFLTRIYLLCSSQVYNWKKKKSKVNLCSSPCSSQFLQPPKRKRLILASESFHSNLANLTIGGTLTNTMLMFFLFFIPLWSFFAKWIVKQLVIVHPYKREHNWRFFALWHSFLFVPRYWTFDKILVLS